MDQRLLLHEGSTVALTAFGGYRVAMVEQSDATAGSGRGSDVMDRTHEEGSSLVGKQKDSCRSDYDRAAIEVST